MLIFTCAIVAHSCSNDCITDSSITNIKEIESKLGIAVSQNSIEERLVTIKLRIDSISTYKTSVFVFEKKDSLRYGEKFEAEIIPVRTYKNEEQKRAVISLKDSIWTIERSGINMGSYFFETEAYSRGLNKVEGLVTIGKDTLPYQFTFFVE